MTAHGSGHVPGKPAADPGSRVGTPASANPPATPPVPPGAPADPAAAAGSGPGHGLVPPTTAERRQTPDRRHANGAGAAPLLALDERDRLTARLHHAVSGFVDGPRGAVEEADDVFEEAARHLTEALAQRRVALRESWESRRPGDAHAADTEELRLALRQYKEATERLLKL
ncbi:MAG TPA: hypothetical protein VNS49_07790 [Streptomyces sp.]|nr:hypothetical protein [Streptomyces sp.]